MPVLRPQVPSTQLAIGRPLDAHALYGREASALASQRLVKGGWVNTDEIRKPPPLLSREFRVHRADCSYSLTQSQAIHYGRALLLSSELLHHAGMGDPYPLTNDEVRRRRLVQLSGLIAGGLVAIAEKAQVSAQNLDHVIKRRRQSGTRRASEDKPLVQLGDKIARRIEAAYGLGEGWFDWPFERVDFASYAALDADQRLIVQGRMIAAIEQAVTQTSAVASTRDQGAARKTIKPNVASGTGRKRAT